MVAFADQMHHNLKAVLGSPEPAFFAHGVTLVTRLRRTLWRTKSPTYKCFFKALPFAAGHRFRTGNRNANH